MNILRELIDVFVTRAFLAVITYARRKPFWFILTLVSLALWPLAIIGLVSMALGLLGPDVQDWFTARKWRFYLIPLALTPFFPLVGAWLAAAIVIGQLRNP